jgi:hypothetical protein
MTRWARLFLLLTILLAALGVLSPGGSAFAASGTGDGTISVTLATPAGIPASVALSAASRYVAAKPAGGTSTTVPLSVAAGAYKVQADPMTIDGQFYVPTSSRPEVPVQAGQTATLNVTYTLDTSARDFHASAVDQTSITLTWTAQPQFRMVVRRTATYAPAKAPDQGIDVPVVGGSAVDSGLQPGTQYTYGLFAQYQAKWVGPMALRVGTASTAKTAAAYVASPQTQILKNSDVLVATTTGTGVRVVLARGLPTPVVGAAVVLPISASLPGGFLGVVSGVSPDGQTLDLVSGGITDAFDYYDISMPDIQGSAPLPLKPAALAATAQATTSPPANGPIAPADRQPLADTSAASSPSSLNPQTAMLAKSAAALAPSTAPSCDLGGSGTGSISFAPSISLAGSHFTGTISKYQILGKNVPIGATLDMSIVATVTGTARVTTSGNLSCNAPLPSVLVPIPQAAPVPLSFYFSPTAQFTVGGSVDMSYLGLTATAGVHVAGHFGLTDGATFSGNPILSAVPTTPTTVKNGTVGLKVGGQIIIGPGAGTPKAGVIAGVGGEFNPIDANFGFVFPQNDPRFNTCLKASAAFTRSLYLVAKAWVGNWDITKSITLDALQGSTDYPGSPWYYPSGCKDAVSPSGTVLGGGVTKINDTVTGGQNQLGYLPGLVPGKTTWVLSTGNVGDVVGVPSKFASTDLGGSGDADLTALAGRPTYDAVGYTVTLVPTASTLHIRYAFASEEYPEYVGSAYNDVMAVYVNGVNCATVPGTTTPVSINTVNMNLNSQYYVDNTTGAAGYSTSMDGLTVPLECKVPVQIGQPVTVKIAIADASDQIYDSAVALLDQGIWAD